MMEASPELLCRTWIPIHRYKTYNNMEGIKMKFSSAIIPLLLACSASFADASDMVFTECKEVSGAAFVVSSLKHDGMSADQIRNEIMDGMDVSKEVKNIYMQQIEMAFSPEHIEKDMDEYNEYVYQLSLIHI